MSTPTATQPTTAREAATPAGSVHTGSSAVRRVWSLTRAELTLLRRNKLLLLNALVLPFLPLLLFLPLQRSGAMDAETTARSVGMMIGFLLLFVVYYNLLSSYVARRDELVLKRLRTGECSDAEILAGTAAPSLLLGVVQSVLLVGAGMLVLDLPAPTNPLVLALAVLGGALVFAALALLTTLFTKNSEAAQITSLPLVLVALAGGGMVVPIPAMPEGLQRVAELTPMAPSTELVQLGWLGRTITGDAVTATEAFAAAGPPTLILLGWVVLSILAVRRYFRWEPRS